MNRREALERAAAVLGYAIAGPSLIGVLKGCKAVPEATFTPVFFNAEQALLVAELCEVIIPRTNTPGAKDAGVPAFIDQMLSEVYDQQGRDAFVKNLQQFDDEATKSYGNRFIECSHEDKVILFRKHHDAAIKPGDNNKSSGFWNAAVNESKPFILELKELTIIGFFTSKEGATQVLQYNAVPGPYKGCVPLSEVGKAWAT